MSTRLPEPESANQQRLAGLLDWFTLFAGWGGIIAFFAGLARLAGAEAVAPHGSKFNAVWTWGLLAGGACIAVAAATSWWRRHHRGLAGPSEDPTGHLLEWPSAPPFDLLSTLLLVIDTSRYSPRTVERVDYEDGYYRHQVSREFMIPAPAQRRWRDRLPFQTPEGAFRGGAERDVLLPVLRLGRGALVDNLEVCRADGTRINTLNGPEYSAAVASLIEQLAQRLSKSPDEILDPDLRVALEHLLEQTAFSHPDDRGEVHNVADEERRSAAFEEVATRLIGIDPPTEYESEEARDDWTELLERLYEFVDAITDAYIILAPFSARPGDRVVINYSFTTPHQPHRVVALRSVVRRKVERAAKRVKRLGHAPTEQPFALPRTRLGLRDGFRYRVGLRPHEHVVRVNEHRWSQSYHLEFWGPPETYVFSCDLESLDEREDDEAPGSIVTFPEAGSRGCDYGHIYVRETARNDYRNRLEFQARFDCREKPPGMLGSIAVVATAEALLIWVIGLHIDSFYPGPGKSGVASDVPALLLALPGLVTGWLGAQFSGERLRSTSLATLVGVVLSGFIAIVSTAVALAKSTEDTIGSFHGIAHPIWLILMIGSASLAADLLLRGAVRSHRYIRRINIPGDDRTLLL